MKINSNTIWRAIENIAYENGLSCSRLARMSGLDATAFNKCKRTSAAGKPHWPSVETVVKVMAAIGLSWADFAKYFPKEMADKECQQANSHHIHQQ